MTRSSGRGTPPPSRPGPGPATARAAASPVTSTRLKALQVERGRQVGLDPVHDEQPVQRRGSHRVELLDRGGLRRHQVERQGLRRQAVPHLQVRPGCRPCAPRAGSAPRRVAGSAVGAGKRPQQRAALLVGRPRARPCGSRRGTGGTPGGRPRPWRMRCLRCRSTWTPTKPSVATRNMPAAIMPLPPGWATRRRTRSSRRCRASAAPSSAHRPRPRSARAPAVPAARSGRSASGEARACVLVPAWWTT